MNRLPRTGYTVALVAAALIALWVALGASRMLYEVLSRGLLLVLSLMATIDALDLMMRLYVRRLQSGGAEASVPPTSIPLPDTGFTPVQKMLHLRPYAIVLSVHNLEAEIDDFVEAMEPLRDRIWMIDDASTDATPLLLKQAGYRCLGGQVNVRKPAALRALLAALPREIETVLVLDPDCRVRRSGSRHLSDLEAVIFDFQISRMAAACPRLVVREDGWLARLQGFEYALSGAVGRKSLADYSITSGAALYQRAALEAALSEHTLSVYAEDLETSILLLSEGQQIYYDGRLVVETAAMRTWASWFSQRVGWSYGFLKVYLERFGAVREIARGRLMAAYQYLFYMGALTLLLHPLRLAAVAVVVVSFANGVDELLALELVGDGLLSEPGVFVAIYTIYTVLALVVLVAGTPRGGRRHLLPVVPIFFFYALLRVMPMTLGFVNYLSLRFAGRRLFRDHYQDESSLVEEHLQHRVGRASRGVGR